MKTTTFDEFRELAREATFVPVCKPIMADLLTPVSAFLNVAAHADHAFLLESVEGGEQIGRYSFLGKDPFLVLRAGPDGVPLLDRSGVTTRGDTGFVPTLRGLMNQFRSPIVPDLPRFTGGAVGFLGYDAASWFEAVPQRPPSQGASPADDTSPDADPAAAFMFFDTILAFDHVRHRIVIIANARVGPGDDLEALYAFACARIGFLERELASAASRPPSRGPGRTAVRANMPRASFEHAVRTAQSHIAEGDIYQVVLSQRFDAEVDVDPFTVYRALRHVNPSPYMFYLRMGSRSIVGASPEMLVRVEGDRIETHPIAGTRPRGRDQADDDRLADELKGSEKERAEHVMLVDLGRNDVGRVAAFGTVRVPQFMGIERYSHVMHLVSIVEGRLADGCDRLDALVSCFPAGTVSGAPKIRAMEIIAALEPDRRGIYAGAVGYVDFAGNLDFCIAIRTIVIVGRRARIQAGAGIVVDSDPAAEYQETCDKAQALVQALDLAAAGLSCG